MKENPMAGYAAQVDNFRKLVAMIKTYGADYNPSNGILSMNNLETYLANGILCMNKVYDAENALAKAVTSRLELFNGLNKKLTRILSALKASGVKDGVYEDVLLLTHLIKPSKSRKPKAAPLAPEEEKPNRALNLTFDKKLDAFYKILGLLETTPEYKPNEDDLDYASLKSFYEDMQAKNEEVNAAEITLNKERLERKLILFNEVDGIFQLSKLIKTYVKSVFGASSPQARQINAIRFRMMFKS